MLQKKNKQFNKREKNKETEKNIKKITTKHLKTL